MMIIDRGKYEPFGKRFLEQRPHLGQGSRENVTLDFSRLDTTPHVTTFHRLFDISEAFKINVGDRSDERYPIQTGSIDNPAIHLEQELYVQGNVVVWSRAGCVMKTFDYSMEDQPIQQVLFAWFPVSSKMDSASKQFGDINLDNTGGYKGSEKDVERETKEEYDDEEKPPITKGIRLLYTDEEDQSDQLQRRALCIVFQNFIKVHYENGLVLTSHIPFEIGQIMPLDRGVIVSRKYAIGKSVVNKGKHRAGSGINLASLAGARRESETATLYTVTHPYKIPCPVKIGEIMIRTSSELPNPMMASQELLFSTTKPTEINGPLILVTLNKKEHKHYIWKYSRRKSNNNISLSSTHNNTLNSYLPAKRKAEEPMVNHRKYSKSMSNPIPDVPNSTENAQSANSPLEEHTDNQDDFAAEEDILFENELEREMYYQLLDTSEISLELLWREKHTLKISAKLKKFKSTNSDVFLIHDLSGKELICIMNYTLERLQVIDLSRDNGNSKDGIILTIAARSAIAIYATRDTYLDLLYIDSQGQPQLFIDKSMPKRDINFNLDTIIKLIDPVYDQCTALCENGDMVRFRINLRPESRLVRDCFSAIDCAASSYFSAVWSAYLDRRERMEEWEAFFITFFSFLRLKKRSARHYYLHNTHKKNGSHIEFTSEQIKSLQIETANREFIQSGLRLPFSGSHQDNYLLNEAYRVGVPMKWVVQILNSGTDVKFEITDFLSIIKGLHVVFEDHRIKKTTGIHTRLLGYLLMQSLVILGNGDWIDYYESCGIESKFAANLQFAENDLYTSITKPPSLQVYLRQMTPSTTSPQVLLSYFSVNTLDPALAFCQNTYAMNIKKLSSLYSAINNDTCDKTLLLERMIAQRITRQDIVMLSEDIAAPILAILDELKVNPQTNWRKEAYSVIGRDDIYKQLQRNVTVCDPNTDTFMLPFQEDSDVPKSMSELMRGPSKTHVNKCTYQTDVLNMETERLRFGFGGVIEKVRIMLDSTKISELYIPENPEKNDEEIATEQQHQLQLLLQRTYALSIGRAVYAFGTHVPDFTKVMPVENLNTSAKILPLRTIANLDENSLPDELLNWPSFHNGVAAGLRISPSNQIDDSWINFCNPPDLEPKHGGMLLALGLNGVLKRLPLPDYYRFMSQSCELALIGFVLATGVAYRGTNDLKIAKVLSMYIPNLSIPNSASFNHSNLMQAAALMAMGLNFMNSCDRQIGASMLEGITKYASSDPSELEQNYEGYALAAGFSLGFITLGAGDRALDTIDKKLTNKLCNLMVGRSSASVAENSFGKEKGSHRYVNADVSSPGAIVALALMYLKTENTKVADAIEIPETRPYLNYVRPDFLLLRVVAKNLIMWSRIQPTDEWIDSQLPDFITQSEQDGSFDHVEPSVEKKHQDMLIDDEVIKQYMYNIICGACLSMGLRFAGSRNKGAFQVLLNRLDFFMKLQLVQETSFQQRITKCTVRTCVDVICTAAAMVMAGTGNRELLSRLEQLNSRIATDMSYGNHMAVSMSLGLLFIGLGGYTLTTSNESIAGLLCAFYPFYPISIEDNRYHLQAFRHFWVLAVDSRWLMPFDVEYEKPCRVPMYLELYDDDGSQAKASERKKRLVRIEAPTVVPDYKLIKSIELEGERYWPLSIDMTESGKYQNSIIKSGMIYVKRKESKKSYEDDISGLFC